MLPALIMVSEPGSFAEHTILVRKPEIIANVIATNDYPPEIIDGLVLFEREIAEEVVASLTPDGVGDEELWRDAWRPWQGRTWRQVGWYLAETYFYRRLLEVVGYFRPGREHLRDPFAPQKREALVQGLSALSSFCRTIPRGLPLRETTSLWLRRSLWGNQVDLSNITVKSQARQGSAEGRDDKVLIDHSDHVWSLVRDGKVREMHWVADNAGLELLSDLLLLDLWLSNELVETVQLHLKPQPFFVSDAMVCDLDETIAALEVAEEPSLRQAGQRLREHGNTGRLLPCTHPFWATSLFFRDFSADLRGDLSRADLIVLKGDVNYRRLVKDRHWPHTTRLEDVTGHMPAPFVTLRTLKAELMLGLAEGQAEQLARDDPNWLINGERGLIHLCMRSAGAPSGSLGGKPE